MSIWMSRPVNGWRSSARMEPVRARCCEPWRGTVPIGGVVALGDQGLHELATRERARRIAMVAQHPVVPEAMLSLAYVLLGRTPHLGFWEMEKAADLPDCQIRPRQSRR